MKISLKNKLAELELNTLGAYIGSFEIKNKAILFPRVMVKIDDSLKVRGGMHVCAPNFGANITDLSLDQHGFARDLEWQVEDFDDSSTLLKLDGIGDYEHVNFYLSYKLEGSSLFAKLKIDNNSTEDKLISPGFHPYFYRDSKPVVLDDLKLDKDKLSDSIYEEANRLKFKANGNDIEIIGKSNINEFVFWTDFMGDYICIEPTYNGNSFEDHTKKSYKLKKGEEFIQEIEVRVNI